MGRAEVPVLRFRPHDALIIIGLDDHDRVRQPICHLSELNLPTFVIEQRREGRDVSSALQRRKTSDSPAGRSVLFVVHAW